MSLYLKYRPQTLTEIVGQESVKHTLTQAILSGKLSHAYLFCGPRGSGKTSTARILAKIVNCENMPIAKSLNAEALLAIPCNRCSSCLSITDGSNLDVIEMDAASNGLVDDIRALRENVKLAASSSKKKVYIIDEVHMMSIGAFNALLKTLEEPPSHVLFILATTEAHKVPATIISRVQRLDFAMPGIAEISQVLEKIIKNEKLSVEREAVLLLAKKAMGSFRDAVKILDQLSGLEKIDAASVEKMLGSGSLIGILELLRALAQKDSAKALISLNTLTSGVSLKELTLNILDILRQIMLIKNSLGESMVKPHSNQDVYVSLMDLAEILTDEQLLNIINSFQVSLEQSRYVPIPTLPLELAVVKSCQMRVQAENKPAARIQEKQDKELEIRGSEPVVPESLVKANLPKGHDALKPGGLDDIQKLQDKWNYILETIRQYNYSLEALLRSAKITACEERFITIEVPYSFHQRILEAPKSRDPLESIFSDILARPVKISTVIGKRPLKVEELANVELAADDEMLRIAAEIFSSEPVN